MLKTIRWSASCGAGIVLFTQALILIALEPWGDVGVPLAEGLAPLIFLAWFLTLLASPLLLLLLAAPRVGRVAAALLAFEAGMSMAQIATAPLMTMHLDSVLRRLESRTRELDRALVQFITQRGRAPRNLEELVPGLLARIPATGIASANRFEYLARGTVGMPSERWHYVCPAGVPAASTKHARNRTYSHWASCLELTFDGTGCLRDPRRSRWQESGPDSVHSSCDADSGVALARAPRLRWVISKLDSLLPSGTTREQVQRLLGKPDRREDQAPRLDMCWVRVELVPGLGFFDLTRDILWAYRDDETLYLTTEKPPWLITVKQLGRWRLRVDDD